MRRPGDEFKTAAGVPLAPPGGSALVTLRDLVEYQAEVYGERTTGSAQAQRALEVLEMDLRQRPATTRTVAEGLRAALANVLPGGAVRDLRGLLEDVTSPVRHLTLEDVLGRVQTIRARLS